MIVYGWNSKNIKQAPLESYECPKCKEQNSHLTIFAHYAHVFWIPLFPYKKAAQIFCAHCQLATEESGMPAELKEKIKQLKSSVSIPKYLFSGLLLIALAVTYFSYSSIEHDKFNQEYINHPQIGDVYVLKDLKGKSAYNHYLLKVNDMVDDSLIVTFNSFTYNGVVTKLDPADGFYDVTYSMHKNGIKDYDASGELKKVIREYTPTAGFDRIIEYPLSDTVGVD